jgi:predicted phosphodiesterase
MTASSTARDINDLARQTGAPRKEDMRLNVLSDLHLSRGSLPAPSVQADLVVLAGDIARPAQAVEWAKGLGRPTLYVPGNHEFYGSSIPETLTELKRLAAGSQVRVLDNEEWCIGNVRFLGCTLWTDFLLMGVGAGRDVAVREALERMYDFQRIHLDARRQDLFTPRDAANLFERSAAWLESRLRTPWPGPTVVVTHHAPSERSVEPKFEGSPLNACFASHLDHLLGAELACTWIHGHVHHSTDYRANGTRVVCNPRGYARDGRNENPLFDIDFVVNVA